MKSISEIRDQNDVLHTSTKEETHDEKMVRKGGDDILNKIYTRAKDGKKLD